MAKKLIDVTAAVFCLFIGAGLTLIITAQDSPLKTPPLLNQPITADDQRQLIAPLPEQEQTIQSREDRLIVPPQGRRQPTPGLDNTNTPPEPTITTHIDYTDDFESFYGKILASPYQFPPDFKLQNPQTILSPNKRYSARLQKTDGGVVPYDQAKAALEFTRFDGQKRYLIIEDFRTLKLNWINDRLAHLVSDIGRVAAVHQIFDVDDGKWIYQKGELYMDAEQGPYYTQEFDFQCVINESLPDDGSNGPFLVGIGGFAEAVDSLLIR
ncbi:hypothetical protein ACFL02_00775 [Planctomycetota bacterium]